MRIAVVGAGIAGLSCARVLAGAGLEVEVFERETSVGGRMSTRMRQGLGFDRGASFLVRAYREIFRLAGELGIELECVSPVDHAVYREGQARALHFSSEQGLFRMDCLSWWSRFRVLRFLVQTRLHYPDLDFFELSRVSPDLNRESAYGLARRKAGHEFADYIVDSFNACMMFYRAEEISAAAFLSLFSMMADPAYDFGVYLARGQMQAIPQAMARELIVYSDCPVLRLGLEAGGWRLDSSRGAQRFDRVVLATTAGGARPLIPSNFAEYLDLLKGTEYSRTVNLSYRVPPGIGLGKVHCYYVPYCESDLICEYTNEAFKGLALVNVGLHEAGARALWELSDTDLAERVKVEFLRLNPALSTIQFECHDLQRWEEAIPKYSCSHIDRVRAFELSHQGRDGLYLCGDYLNAPWLEGACRSGQRVARAILEG